MSRLVIAVLVATAAGAACGVPTDDAPEAVPRADVPFDLLAPAATSATTTSLVAVTTEVPVYLVGPDRLVVVRSLVEPPLSLILALESLLAGPSDDESAT